jgi:very-short-patch-repair endonuclease
MRRAPGGRGAGRARRRLNDTPTPAEAAFASALTDLGVRFTQNATIRTAESSTGFYVADFKLPEHRLFVELDGKPHVSERARWNDRLRTEAIERAHPAYRVVRFWNSEVMSDPHAAIRSLINA